MGRPAEAVPETVIAAISLLDKLSIDEIVGKLTPPNWIRSSRSSGDLQEVIHREHSKPSGAEGPRCRRSRSEPPPLRLLGE